MVIDRIKRDYESTVQVQRIYWYSPEGMEKIKIYNLNPLDWNTIVVNGEVILKGGDQFVDETLLRRIIDYYLAQKHDIAISDVTVNFRSILKGDILNINATVRNKGKQSESFNITVLFNSTVVEELHVKLLEPGAERVFSFYINTTRIGEGRYSLTIYAIPVENEVNINDNLYNAGVVEIKTSETGSTCIHDIAVLEIRPSKTWATNREQVNITVLVKNHGTIAEKFTLKILLNDSLIVEKLVYLNPGYTFSKVFTIDLADLTSGNYIIRAVVELEGDLNRENNEYSFGINVLNTKSETDRLYFVGNIFLAFIFGFFETFSPCLLTLLSFLVSYTLGETASFMESFTKILTFGTGFLLAALLTSTLAIFLFIIVPFQKIMTIIVCIFAFLFGLNAIGINITLLPLFKKQQDAGTKMLVQKFAKKYAETYAGMVVVGFLFYFLDPCIVPFFFAIIPLILSIDFTIIVLAFCLGVMFPFIIIGVVTGSLSRLVRISYRHKSKLRLISGLVLLCYSIYLIVFYFSSFFLR